MERESLKEWSNLVASGLSKETWKSRRKQGAVLPTTNLTVSDVYYLVHGRDFDRLWESYKLLNSHSPFTLPSVKPDLERIMFSHTCGSDYQGLLHERVLRKWAPVSLLCSEHCLVLNPAVFVQLRSQDSDSAILWRFHDDMCVLLSTEYLHFLRVVLRLYELLFPISHDEDSSSTIGEPYVALDGMFATLSSSFHPQIRAMMDVGSCNDDSFTFLTLSIGSSVVEHRLAPAMCADQRCNDDCIELLGTRKRLRPNDCDSDGGPRQGASLPSKATSDTDDEVRIVKGPAETKSDDLGLGLRVLAVDAKTNLDEFIACLGRSDSQDSVFRRSGRMRKQRYQFGGAKVEEFLSLRRCHNLAAVRLHVLEKLAGFNIDQSFIFLLNCDDADSNKLKIEIPSAWNERSISEVVVDATKSLRISDDDLEKVFNGMTLIFHVNEEAHPKQRTARNRDDEAQREALMESLLLVANLTDHFKPKTDAKNGSRRAERGFTGTLLQSAFKPADGAGDVLSTQGFMDVKHEDTSKRILNSETSVYMIAESDSESVVYDGQREQP